MYHVIQKQNKKRKVPSEKEEKVWLEQRHIGNNQERDSDERDDLRFILEEFRKFIPEELPK